MQPGDADIFVHHHLRSEQLRAYHRLADDRAVGSTPRDDRHHPPRLRNRPRDPCQAGELVLLHVVCDPSHRASYGCIGARDEHAPGSRFEHRRCDRGDLPGRLAVGQDRLGYVLAKFPMDIRPSETEIAERQLSESLERGPRLDLAATHVFKQLVEIIAQRHRRI